MEILSTMMLIVIGLVWFFETWGKNKAEAERLRRQDEAEEASYQRERAYFADLRAKADAGDEQAAFLLKWHGWGWEH